MNTKAMVTLGSALALSLAPFTASAYTPEKALNACAAALTVKISDGEMSWRIDEDSLGGGNLSELSMFHLDARNSETDEVVARADCVVDNRAKVKRIKILPLDAGDAKERVLSAY
jgi:hypothetical protein